VASAFIGSETICILDALDECPESSRILLIDALDNFDNQLDLKRLKIIIAAARPPTSSEVNVALAIEDGDRSNNDLNLEETSTFETSIRHIYGLFVDIIDQRVYLIHQTAREFLIGMDGSTVGQWKHSFTLIDSQLTMAEACVTYLSFTVYEKESVALAEKHDFFSYATFFFFFFLG
jgi:hypothetical protein